MDNNRRFLGARSDGFVFKEVFGDRFWHAVKYPAAALFAMRSNASLKVEGVLLSFLPSFIH
jgi:hypothetical protein